MAEKHISTKARPPLHREGGEGSRPVPKRTWRHARYGDAPEPALPGDKAATFSESDDAARTGDAPSPKS